MSMYDWKRKILKTVKSPKSQSQTASPLASGKVLSEIPYKKGAFDYNFTTKTGLPEDETEKRAFTDGEESASSEYGGKAMYTFDPENTDEPSKYEVEVDNPYENPDFASETNDEEFYEQQDERNAGYSHDGPTEEVEVDNPYENPNKEVGESNASAPVGFSDGEDDVSSEYGGKAVYTFDEDEPKEPTEESATVNAGYSHDGPPTEEVVKGETGSIAENEQEDISPIESLFEPLKGVGTPMSNDDEPEVEGSATANAGYSHDGPTEEDSVTANAGYSHDGVEVDNPYENPHFVSETNDDENSVDSEGSVDDEIDGYAGADPVEGSTDGVYDMGDSVEGKQTVATDLSIYEQQAEQRVSEIYDPLIEGQEQAKEALDVQANLQIEGINKAIPYVTRQFESFQAKNGLGTGTQIRQQNELVMDIASSVGKVYDSVTMAKYAIDSKISEYQSAMAAGKTELATQMYNQALSQAQFNADYLGMDYIQPEIQFVYDQMTAAKAAHDNETYNELEAHLKSIGYSGDIGEGLTTYQQQQAQVQEAYVELESFIASELYDVEMSSLMDTTNATMALNAGMLIQDVLKEFPYADPVALQEWVNKQPKDTIDLEAFFANFEYNPTGDGE